MLLLLIFLCFLIAVLTSPDMLALHSARSADIFFHTSSFRLKFTFWILKRWTIICHSCPTIIIFPFFFFLLPPKCISFLSAEMLGASAWCLEDKRHGIEQNFCPATENLQCSDMSVRPHLALNCHGKLRLPFAIKRSCSLTLISGPVKTLLISSVFQAQFQSPFVALIKTM